MFRSFQSMASLALALIGVSPVMMGEEVTWIFEGLVTKADPVLAPDLKSGWVLSGSFLLDPLAMEEDTALATERAGRLTEGVSNAELTIDLYYQVHFQGLQVPGIAGFDYQNDDPEENGRDLIGWFFPMRGNLKETDWSLRWLQIWLLDSEGKMIRTTPPPIPPAGFQWRGSWFRLILVNEDGEEAFVEGSLEFFSPETALEDDEEEKLWDTIVADLGNQLVKRDARIEGLQNELEETRARLDSLRRMVDLLVEERASLQKENALLAEKAQPDNAEIEEKLANLTAEKALAEQNLEDLQDRNLALAETLGESERERRRLLAQLEDLELASKAPDPSAEAMQGEIQSPEGTGTGTITVYEQPMVIEKPVVMPTEPVETSLPPTTKPPRESERRSRFGPRKFR
ncbi:hypothetical protein G0Q06_01760 [Puniceicoccales bacterium CK1056]|uniref:Uncharacterized protein n=1 Tax=Oceanipulchritudo coccoides TaxID=2706888 RepID=A0A6B2M098_9BACT|nr:hypothetical protein [Oceanipulchritudo coccoides]NDV61170.1 hypothetical protein [Oceanipulchritudo coccoides]